MASLKLRLVPGMANLLDQLAAMTVVVADTGDIDAIQQFTPGTPPPTHH